MSFYLCAAIYICSRWSYLFDYDIEHFAQAFEYVASREPRDPSEIDKEIEQIIRCACGTEQVVEDDEELDWGDEVTMPKGRNT